MNANELVFLGLKGRVAALRKDNGQIAWSTILPGGSDFVTVAGEGNRIYASSGGRIHCLELGSGKILWSNGLKGYGFGVASIWLAGHPMAPPAAAYEKVRAGQQSTGAETAVVACC